MSPPKDVNLTQTSTHFLVDYVSSSSFAQYHLASSNHQFFSLVIGDDNPKNVKGIKIKNVKTNEVIEMNLDGVFIAIGHDPATQLFKDQLEMDNEGYLVTKSDSTETNVPGVFAAGDVKDKVFRQAVTAAGMGCMAALEAEKHISHN